MKNKLSPLEQLRSEKRLLKDSIKEHETVLKDNFTYTKNNLGSLVVSSIFSYSTNTIKNMFGFGDSDSSGKKSFLDKALVILPVVWNFVQPIVISIVTKKMKSFFSAKAKKNK